MFRVLQTQSLSQSLERFLRRIDLSRAAAPDLQPAGSAPAFAVSAANAPTRRRRQRRKPIYAGTGIRSTWH